VRFSADALFATHQFSAGGLSLSVLRNSLRLYSVRVVGGVGLECNTTLPSPRAARNVIYYSRTQSHYAASWCWSCSSRPHRSRRPTLRLGSRDLAPVGNAAASGAGESGGSRSPANALVSSAGTSAPCRNVGTAPVPHPRMGHATHTVYHTQCTRRSEKRAHMQWSASAGTVCVCVGVSRGTACYVMPCDVM
jgi:hypothetical protein